MTTEVASISRDEMRQLISSGDGERLSEAEVEAFNRFVLVSQYIWRGEYRGQLLGMWGLIPPTLLSDQAYLWLYTTPAAEEHTFILVRRGQIELKKMLELYPRIVGHCEVGAARSIRWLKWLGAKFAEPQGSLIPFVIGE